MDVGGGCKTENRRIVSAFLFSSRLFSLCGLDDVTHPLPSVSLTAHDAA